MAGASQRPRETQLIDETPCHPEPSLPANEHRTKALDAKALAAYRGYA